MRGVASFVFVILTACCIAQAGNGTAPLAMKPPDDAIALSRQLRLSPEILNERLKDGHSILMRSGVFDPLREGEPVAARVTEPSKNPYQLVQFQSDLTPEQRNAFEAAGVRFIDYIPSHTYIVRTLAPFSLQRSGMVRWQGSYVSFYKIDPALLTNSWSSVYLSFRVFPDENAMALLDRLRSIDPQIGFAALHGELSEGARLRVFVPAGHLHPFVDIAAEDAAVWTVEPWFLPHIDNDNSIWITQNYDTTNTTNYNLSATMWNHGITGTGQTPAVADTGLDSDMCFFRYSSAGSAITDSQSPALPNTGTIDTSKKVEAYYVLPNAAAYDTNATCPGGSSAVWHGTHVSGTVLGDNFATLSTPTAGGHDTADGMAPNAKLIMQDAGDASGCLSGLSNDLNLVFQQAYNAGARIHSNSWGSDVAGVYTSESQSVDHFLYTHEDFQLFFANGNAGPTAGTVGSPATAKDCVSVGSVNSPNSVPASNGNTVASSSSRGPAADGRRKPDVSAPGASIRSAAGDTNHASNNCSNKLLSGTSMATPTTAGGATLLRQYFTDGFYPTGAASAADSINPSGALLKAALINGAVNIANTTQATVNNSLAPSNGQGYGRIMLDNAAFFSGDARRLRVWDKLNATGITAGGQDAFTIQVAAGQPLKVTLAWTDPESSTAAAVNLVNNLDLEVVDPSANVYKGNVFAAGQSTTLGSADTLNNVEEFFLTAPAAGTWTLRVKGTSVPGTPLESYSDRQGYALVATYANCASSLAAPASPLATDNGSTGVDLSWSAVGGAPRYQVYRAAGTCSAPAGDFRYIGQTTGTTFTDNLVQGGYSYAYKFRAADNCSDGAASICVTATYSGNCALYPTFSGISSATNDAATGACDVSLNWGTAASNCPLSNSVRYNLYRGTTPYFSIGAGSRIATGLSGTSYRDISAAANTTYYYAVRAEDGTSGHSGPANGGNEDLNTVLTSATASANTTSPGTWSDAGGDNALARLILESPWRVSNQQNHTGGGSLSYHAAPDAATYPSNTCASAMTPAIQLQAGAPQLSYWAAYNLEDTWDGVVVELSTDGGANWTILNPTPAYPDNFSSTGATPINACAYPSTQACFGGPAGNLALTPFVQYTHTLTAYANQSVTIRWRLSTDPGSEYEGFYLDDIQITNASVPNACATPPGAASSAMTASKLTVNGSNISVAHTASCSSTQYEIVYGSNSTLPSSYLGTYGITGAACNIGTSSPYSWIGTPAVSAGNFLWWVVVATDGSATEGAWGKNSGNIDRTGPGTDGSSGQCAITGKNISNACGQ